MPEDNELLCDTSEGPKWLPISRELARVLCPDSPPGVLPSNFNLALAPASLEEASRDLDVVGLPRLEQTGNGLVEAGVVSGFAVVAGEIDDGELEGEDDELVDVAQPGTQESSESRQLDRRGGGTVDVPSETGGVDEAPAAFDASPKVREPGVSGTGSQIGSDDPRADGPVTPIVPLTGGEAERQARRATSPSTSASQGRLRSYIVPEGRPTPSPGPSHDGISALDAAGIARVLRFEEEQGRQPKEMPHHHPGYDIESRVGEQVHRLIEVKSTAGPWDSYGVGLSSTQFASAQEHRGRYWLYVVEHAESDQEFKIHRIQNPAGRVDQFLLDAEWARVGEAHGLPDVEFFLQEDVQPYKGWVPLRRLTESPIESQNGARWVPCSNPEVALGWYAVQLLGHALEPTYPLGSVVLIRPASGEDPGEGTLVVAELWGDEDPETRAMTTVRHWWPETDRESKETLFVNLAGDSC